MVDQVRVHQGVTQDQQAVIAFVGTVEAGAVETERIEDPAHLGIAERLGAQGRHRAEELLELQRLSRIGAHLVMQAAYERVGRGDLAVAARIDGHADEVAVRCKRHHGDDLLAHVAGELGGALVEGFGGEDRLPGQQAEVAVVQWQHAMGHEHRRGIRAGLGALRDELAEAAVALEVGFRRAAMEDVVGLFREQGGDAMIAAEKCAGAERQVAELVRIDGDRVGFAERGDRCMHLVGGKRLVVGGNLVAAAQAAILVAEHGRQVAAPGRIHVHRMAEAGGAGSLTHFEHAIDRIDRAVLGGAEHADRHQHRLALAFAALEHGFEGVGIEAHAAFGQQLQLCATKAEQLEPLAPGVVRGHRCQHPWHAQVCMAGEESGQAHVLDARRLHALAPALAVGRGLRGKPGLVVVEQIRGCARMQVEGLPVVLGQGEVGHAGIAQGNRKGLQREGQAQGLVVGNGAARGQVAERAIGLRGIVPVADHARQLQADLHFHVHRHRRGIFADVVRVVGQGQDLRHQPGQQQVGDHVAEIARTVERHRLLQRGRELMQLTAHARLERQVIGMPGRLGRDCRRIFGVEVAPPVDMVAQKLDNQTFEQAVVLSVRPEETGIDPRTVRGESGLQAFSVHRKGPGPGIARTAQRSVPGAFARHLDSDQVAALSRRWER